MEKVLQVKNLTINFRTINGEVQAVRNVSFDLERGKTMAIVGESGSGKSVTSKAILGILANNAIVKGGKIYYDGKDLLKICEDDFHKIRGDKIAMIFQDPMSSLNPIVRIGKQLTEAMILKNKANRRNSRHTFNYFMKKLVRYMDLGCENGYDFGGISNSEKSEAFDKFEFVHLELENSYNTALNHANDLIPEIDNIVFEISKNVYNNCKITLNDVIKYAPLTKDRFFIEDNSQILEQVNIIKNNSKKAYETKDFSEIVEALLKIKDMLLVAKEKKAPNFFSLAYYLTFVDNNIPDMSIEEMDEKTHKLLDENFMFEFIEREKKALIYSFKESIENSKMFLTSIEKLSSIFNNPECNNSVLNAELKTSYRLALESIDKLDIYKTSLAYTYRSSIEDLMKKYFSADKVNAKLTKEYLKQKEAYNAIVAKGKTPNWNIKPIVLWDKELIKNEINENLQIITNYLKKYISTSIDDIDFNKRAVDLVDFFKTNASNVVNKVDKRSAKTKAIKLMQEVGIPEPYKRYRQYPFEFSGGMRQRIVIAIALAADPEILICDEPTTALDVTIQSQILELINKLKKERNLSIIFITHDMGVVANMADEISVMYAGKIVEKGTVNDIFYDPKHPYTWALLSSMPDLETKEKLDPIPGTPPNMIYPPVGDAFAERNKYALQIDFEKQPPMFKVSETHEAATWLLHPSAPQVEMPEMLKMRIERMKKATVTDNE